MHNFDDITLVLCIDQNHIEELKFAWETWEFFKPELVGLKNKLLIYDADIENSLKDLSFLDETFSYHRFDHKSYYKSQRDAMLTSWFEGCKKIKTRFYLKIDTDCFAINSDKGWVDALADRDNYKIISNPWGYTKNAERLTVLDNWGDTAKHIKDYPRLNLIPNTGSDKIVHSRIISFIGVFDTDWTNMISEDCFKDNHYELPDPSQDTFTWYCAERRKDPVKRISFKKFGFIHTRLHKAKKNIVLQHPQEHKMSHLNTMVRHRSAKISDRYTDLWQELAELNYPKNRILSYGCGLGEECFSLYKHFASSTIKGVDIQKRTIERAISKNKNPSITFEISDYQKLLQDERYDIIFAMNVFKIIKITPEELHKRYPLEVFDAQMKDLIELLNNGGLFVIDGNSYPVEKTSVYKNSLIEIDCNINRVWKKNKDKYCVFKKI